MTIVAEGVEDEATLELLESLGVDLAQGYFLGRPRLVDGAWPPE
jgi:EAL domain-containing protein (putative c-di-GMP-specific phosphodiesterase class I)